VPNRADAANQAVDQPWFIVGRLREYDGEQRANLLRIVGIAAFYAIELINRYGLQLGFVSMGPVAGVDQRFHLAVTALAVVWTMVAMGVWVSLRNQIFPASLKYITTACDIVLLTSILAIADAPSSPLVAGYFLLIALSALRFNVNLIRFATVGVMAGYLFLNGYARWFTERDIRVPRYHQVIVLLALALTGVIIGQVLRTIHGMAREYAQRSQNAAQKES
jgi:hypothetical protein